MPETQAMLLDIEGTTTAVAFVYEVLFPYARTHLQEFLQSHAGEDSLEADLARLRVEQDGDPEQSSGTAAEYLTWLMWIGTGNRPLSSQFRERYGKKGIGGASFAGQSMRMSRVPLIGGPGWAGESQSSLPEVCSLKSFSLVTPPMEI